MRAVGVSTMIQSVRKEKKKAVHMDWRPALPRNGIVEPSRLFLCVEFMSNFLECWVSELKEVLVSPWPNILELAAFKCRIAWLQTPQTLTLKDEKKMTITTRGRNGGRTVISQHNEMFQHQNQRGWGNPRPWACVEGPFLPQETKDVKSNWRQRDSL